MTPSRFLFSVLSGIAAMACVAPLSRAPSTSTPVAFVAAPDVPREQTADQQAKHVLNRLAFGARPGDLENVRAMGVDIWIAKQLAPERIANGRINEFLTRYPTLAMSSRDLLRRYPPPQALLARRREELRQSRAKPDSGGRPSFLATRADSIAFRRAGLESRRVLLDLQIAKVARAVSSERQLEEVMVDFWENHFSVFAGKGSERYFLASYEREAIRPHALGRFRNLLGAVARSPAMLFYLDNWRSAAEPGRPVLGSGLGIRDSGFGGYRTQRRRPGIARRAPNPRIPNSESRIPSPESRPRGLNENYARELLELHTLGVDGGFTQEDVINVARALTGWSLQSPRRDGGFIFRPQMHDAGEKILLGHKLRAGRGIEDGEQVLDIVSRHPSTARFIATKLAQRFVSDSPPPALVDRAARAFMRSDGDIRELVRSIVTSPEFFSSAAYRSKVKSPFELVTSALRSLGANPDSTPRTAQIIARLGQPLYLHQAPNGYPETSSSWINTGAILNRINFGLAVGSARVPGLSIERWPPYASLVTASRAQQVDGVVAAVLGGEASPDTRKILASGANPLLTSSALSDTVMPRATADPEGHEIGMEEEDARTSRDLPRGQRRQREVDPLSRPANLEGLGAILGLALGAPEFQRR